MVKKDNNVKDSVQVNIEVGVKTVIWPKQDL